MLHRFLARGLQSEGSQLLPLRSLKLLEASQGNTNIDSFVNIVNYLARIASCSTKKIFAVEISANWNGEGGIWRTLYPHLLGAHALSASVKEFRSGCRLEVSGLRDRPKSQPLLKCQTYLNFQLPTSLSVFTLQTETHLFLVTDNL